MAKPASAASALSTPVARRLATGWRRWRDSPKWRPPRRLKFTRLGRWYTALTVVIGIGAINTGNNLLFLVLGLLLSGIVLSGVLSESALRGVRVERLLPSAATALEPALVGLRVHNAKARIPSFAIAVEDVGAEWPDGAALGRAFFMHLGAGESREGAYRFLPQRRGQHRFEGLRVLTRYPFGLFEKWREVESAETVVVFPRRIEVPESRERESGREGEAPAGRAGQGSEFHALRDYRAGDDARNIHWRSTARTGRVVVVERERERRRRVALSLDNRGDPEDLGAQDGLDRACEKAAALAERFIGRGCEVALATAGQDLPYGAGPSHLHRILTALALLKVEPEAAPPRAPRGAGAPLRVGVSP
jgi:uncharacterized protein (DUF58 family)